MPSPAIRAYRIIASSSPLMPSVGIYQFMDPSTGFQLHATLRLRRPLLLLSATICLDLLHLCAERRTTGICITTHFFFSHFWFGFGFRSLGSAEWDTAKTVKGTKGSGDHCLMRICFSDLGLFRILFAISDYGVKRGVVVSAHVTETGRETCGWLVGNGQAVQHGWLVALLFSCVGSLLHLS